MRDGDLARLQALGVDDVLFCRQDEPDRFWVVAGVGGGGFEEVFARFGLFGLGLLDVLEEVLGGFVDLLR